MSQIEKIMRDFGRFAKAEVTQLASGLFEAVREDAARSGPANGSPVESGRFSASVTMEVGSVDEASMLAATNHKRGGPRTIRLPGASPFRRRLTKLTMGQSIYIAVTLPYGKRIEFRGHSPKTPSGVMRVSSKNFIKRFKFMRAKARAALLS